MKIVNKNSVHVHKSSEYASSSTVIDTMMSSNEAFTVVRWITLSSFWFLTMMLKCSTWYPGQRKGGDHSSRNIVEFGDIILTEGFGARGVPVMIKISFIHETQCEETKLMQNIELKEPLHESRSLNLKDFAPPTSNRYTWSYNQYSPVTSSGKVNPISHDTEKFCTIDTDWSGYCQLAVEYIGRSVVLIFKDEALLFILVLLMIVCSWGAIDNPINGACLWTVTHFALKHSCSSNWN